MTQPAVEWLLENIHIIPKFELSVQDTIDKAKQMEKEQIIAFHKWMLVNDTEQNAEKYFQYSDEDMWHEFLNNK
jgi:hypothetical protein